MTLDAFIGLVMLLVLLGAIFIGVPISFTLLFLAFSFGYLGMGATVFDLAYFQTIGMMKEELLAAVPLFIFMGFITEQAGLMERLFTAFRLILAPVRGALYLVVILTATVFAMATGIVGAAVTVLGIMASPIMIKSGYDAKLSAGTITAGGTLGILIPPSVMLIVMGPVLGVSVADLYAAAFGPGFLLAGLYVVYLMARSIWNPKLGPPVPKEERVHSFGVMLREVIVGVVPLVGLITATLGSILAGLATPTEASGIGTVGALALALAYRKLSFGWAATRPQLDNVHNEHGTAVGGHIQHLRRGLCPAGNCKLDHQHAAVIRAATDVHARDGVGVDFPAGLAVRMAGDRAGVSADFLSGRRRAEDRHDLVRCAYRGDVADGISVATGRHVGLLSQAGGEGLEPGHHLQRDVSVHDPAGHLYRPADLLPANYAVVSGETAGRGARGKNSRRIPQDHRAAAQPAVDHVRR